MHDAPHASTGGGELAGRVVIVPQAVAGDLASEESRLVLAEMVSELFPDQAAAALENLTGASGTR